MNSEFPSRIPTVVNNTSNTTSADAQSEKSFREKVISIFNKIINSLRGISDSIAHIFTRNTKPQITRKEEQNERKQEVERTSFYKKMSKGLGVLKDAWATGISNLQSTLDSTIGSISGAIGGVFGSGIFGRLISNVIQKALSFAVSKLLVGMVLSHLPTIAIIGGIVAAVGALIYYAEDIWNFMKDIGQVVWDAVKWVGNEVWSGLKWIWEQLSSAFKWVVDGIDQAIDRIISILPWSDSKYDEARKGLSDMSVLDEGAVTAYYGDTVEGRARMLDDWRRAQTDEAFKEELRQKLLGKRQERKDAMQDFINQVQGNPERSNMTLLRDVTASQLPPGFFDAVKTSDDYLDALEAEETNIDSFLVSPIVNNNASLSIPNFFGSNVSMMYPSSSIYNEFNKGYSPFGGQY